MQEAADCRLSAVESCIKIIGLTASIRHKDLRSKLLGIYASPEQQELHTKICSSLVSIVPLLRVGVQSPNLLTKFQQQQ